MRPTLSFLHASHADGATSRVERRMVELSPALVGAILFENQVKCLYDDAHRPDIRIDSRSKVNQCLVAPVDDDEGKMWGKGKTAGDIPKSVAGRARDRSFVLVAGGFYTIQAGEAFITSLYNHPHLDFPPRVSLYAL